jgi:uncharacterized membrane protein YgdD (TMEM256/DUF423 family)
MMPDTPHRQLIWAGFLLATATALGAFGTHALKPILPEARFDSFQIGVTYQFFHALGLLGMGLLQSAYPTNAWLKNAARLLVLGILIFSGSIYAMTFGAPRSLGMIAPIGGLSLIGAWLVFVIAVIKLPKPPRH